MILKQRIFHLQYLQKSLEMFEAVLSSDTKTKSQESRIVVFFLRTVWDTYHGLFQMVDYRE